MRVTIMIVGKKNAGLQWLEDGYATYEKRSRSNGVEVVTEWCKGNDELVGRCEKDKGKVVLCDLGGRSLSSEKFSEKVYSWLEEGGSRVTFVIGGAEGLPKELLDDRRRFGERVKLSDMTFTHTWARTVLGEQIYRASEIRKGTGYHK